MPRTPTSPALHYDVHGAEGSPVLLIMGFGMRGSMWQPQLEGLSPRHRVVTFDHRGIGESAPVQGSMTMAELAADALRVADAAGFHTMHVVGVSLGGMIAQELALAAAGRVRSLTLVATQAGGALGWLPTLEGVRLFLKANRSSGPGRLRALEELLYPRAFLETCDRRALAQRTGATVTLLAAKATRLAQLRAVLQHDTRRRLSRLRMPTLIVRPGLDVLIRPQRSDELSRLIPHARVLRYDDAGHGVVYQHASLINASLLDHFAAAEERS
jgi:3-oxoadipate enol-lactonase